jgi:hypothetical protein
MQTSRQSMIESLGGTAIGFIISVLVWQFVVNPVWGFNTTVFQNLNITLLFTVVSVIRSYYVRRIFNHLHTNKNKKVHDDKTADRSGG